ncbi:MAG TPA: NAD(+)/NADH kinase [Verrucomicrobiales bacterium]|nr:NAD(+)/NADH kinase [Verrucomicrobiales bacterium]
MDTQRVGVAAHTGKVQARTVLARVVEDLSRCGLEVLLEQETASLLEAGRFPEHSLPRLAREVDLIVVLGGDGTMLRVAREAGPHPPPLMGVNLGTLGFLSCASPIEEVAGWIHGGQLRVSHRTLISFDVLRGTNREAAGAGLNEVAVSRSEAARSIHVDLRIDGEFVNRYHGDGLLVATPTGSTAYSLSAGGPIAVPESGVFVITPICAHSLNSRSIVVRDDAALELVLEAEGEPAVLSVDGATVGNLGQGDCVRVTRASYHLPLVMLPRQSFYQTLRRKLQWYGSSAHRERETH